MKAEGILFPTVPVPIWPYLGKVCGRRLARRGCSHGVDGFIEQRHSTFCLVHIVEVKVPTTTLRSESCPWLRGGNIGIREVRTWGEG